MRRKILAYSKGHAGLTCGILSGFSQTAKIQAAPSSSSHYLFFSIWFFFSSAAVCLSASSFACLTIREGFSTANEESRAVGPSLKGKRRRAKQNGLHLEFCGWERPAARNHHRIVLRFFSFLFFFPACFWKTSLNGQRMRGLAYAGDPTISIFARLRRGAAWNNLFWCCAEDETTPSHEMIRG